MITDWFKNKLGVPKNWDKYDYSMPRYSFDDMVDFAEQYHKEQLMLGAVGNSSDLIVVELSDDEIKIISEQELKEWQQSAIEFDGFEAWIVRGRLVKNR